MKLHIVLLFMTIWSCPVFCWDSVEMEVFDVVEEVNQNFYELMGISPNAALADIKKAYRTLSKQIHPDKSDAPDADIKFRQMVAVYEVLKDPERRGHYDRVLVEGLPDWRSAVYYYRRARKMSMLEITFILIVVISISQYLMAWGTYFDQWKTLDDVISRKYKGRSKNKKRSEEGDILEEALASIPKPSMLNVLPIQLVRGIYYYTVNGPQLFREHREEQKRRKEEQEQTEREEEEERIRWEKEEEERKARKAAPKRRRQVVVPEAVSGRRKGLGAMLLQAEAAPEPEPAAMGYNTGMWTHEELCDLTKLMNKYPGGTVDRWDVIAEQLNRAPHEVTKMAAKMKDKIAAGTWLADQDETTQTKIKTKTRAAAGPDAEESQSSDEHWSAVQQRALERALKMLPKGTDQRWEKIAKQVPEKSAEDCINRFKFLAEKIRKKKEEENAAKEADASEEATEGGDKDEEGGSEGGSQEAPNTEEESEVDDDSQEDDSDVSDVSSNKGRVNKRRK